MSFLNILRRNYRVTLPKTRKSPYLLQRECRGSTWKTVKETHFVEVAFSWTKKYKCKIIKE